MLTILYFMRSYMVFNFQMTFMNTRRTKMRQTAIPLRAKQKQKKVLR